MMKIKRMFPKVSIGFPVYNGEDLIRSALDSLLSQSFDDFEIILSDNASTDGTETICREYAKKDSRVLYFRQAENRGAAFNFQFVLNEARGEYFMWAAHDDRRAPNFITDCLNVFATNPDCVSVFCHVEVVDRKSDRITSRVTPTSFSSDSALYRVRSALTEMTPTLIYGLHKSEIIRRITIESFDWFDVYFVAVLAFYGKIFIIPHYLYIYGTKGKRKPYSIEGKYIDFRIFRLKTVTFLKEKFSFKERLSLILRVYRVSRQAERSFRKIIDNWPHEET